MIDKTEQDRWDQRGHKHLAHQTFWNSAKWLFSLSVIWGFESRDSRPPYRALSTPKTLPTVWSTMAPHRASAAQSEIPGRNNTRSVQSRSVTWWSLAFVRSPQLGNRAKAVCSRITHKHLTHGHPAGKLPSPEGSWPEKVIYVSGPLFAKIRLDVEVVAI